MEFGNLVKRAARQCHPRQTRAMGVVFTVQADSEREAESVCRRLCELLGAVPVGRPMDLPGRPRWMARAQLTAPRSKPAAHE